MIATFMKRVRSWLASLLDKLFHGGEGLVPPVRIRAEVEAAAWELAVRWESGSVSFPNAYRLRFDGFSWDHYYGKRVSETSRHVKAMVMETVMGAGGSVEAEITVSLAPDESLPTRSVTVDAAFTAPTVKPEVAWSGGEDTMPIDHGKSRGADVDRPADRSGAETEYVTPKIASGPKTKLTATNKVACLVSPLFEAPIRLESGYTIGVPRYSDTTLPDVQLPMDEAFSRVSHLHATFKMNKDGAWFIESCGRNGTTVTREGVEERVEEDRPHTLLSGDVITLGGVGETKMTILVGRNANKELQKEVIV